MMSTATVDNSVGRPGEVLARPRQCWVSSGVLRNGAGAAENIFRRHEAGPAAFRACGARAATTRGVASVPAGYFLIRKRAPRIMPTPSSAIQYSLSSCVNTKSVGSRGS